MRVVLLWIRVELPPRARRILGARIRNYLRVRGEYHQNPTLVDEIAELPPRARRIPGSYCPCYRTRRTTSACAENTPGGAEGLVRGWNYLRVRGEYSYLLILTYWPAELPPRARRIPLHALVSEQTNGTTSACAENTTVDHQPPG